jgi:hypothetical protein
MISNGRVLRDECIACLPIWCSQRIFLMIEWMICRYSMDTTWSGDIGLSSTLAREINIISEPDAGFCISEVRT